MTNVSSGNQITLNGITAGFDSPNNVLLVSLPSGGEPQPLILENIGSGEAEILVSAGDIELLGQMLGGKSQLQMEEAFTTAARGRYSKVVFSTE